MIGLLGGSFDPVHAAHLAMADAFATALSLDEVRFLPASRPWQKPSLSASGSDRLAMLRAALGTHRPSHGRFTIDPRELDRAGATFTIDTLGDLRRELGDVVPLVFLFGADQLVHLDTWHDWRGLWRMAHLAVVTRPGFALSGIPADVEREWTARALDAASMRRSPAGGSFVLEGLSLAVSATAIRALIAWDPVLATAVEGLVAPTVLDYIRANRLYRS